MHPITYLFELSEHNFRKSNASIGDTSKTRAATDRSDNAVEVEILECSIVVSSITPARTCGKPRCVSPLCTDIQES
jgi:hypothetical protein